MDVNLFVVAGKVAAPPEIREYDSGSTMVRVLVTTRTDTPRRRVDVVPIVRWMDDDRDRVDRLRDLRVGQHVWVTGSIQRRFWQSQDGRSSRLEVVAAHIETRDIEGEK
jgi:single-stranded DNA-binding protein